MSEIHKNRGNRRRRDRLKRKHKFNLAKSLFDTFNEVLGKYDKGHIYDLNNKNSGKYETSEEYYKDGISYADKKKIEDMNEQERQYQNSDEIDEWFDEVTGTKKWWEWFWEDEEEYIKMCEENDNCECEPYSKYINVNSNEKKE